MPPVTERGSLGANRLRGTVTEASAAPTPQSVMAPTAAGPALLPGERSTRLRHELQELDQTMPRAESQEGEVFLTVLPSEDLVRKRRREYESSRHVLPTKRIGLGRRSPSSSEEGTRSKAQRTGEASFLESHPVTQSHDVPQLQHPGACEESAKGATRQDVDLQSGMDWTAELLFRESSRKEAASKKKKRERRGHGAGSGTSSDGGDGSKDATFG